MVKYHDLERLFVKPKLKILEEVIEEGVEGDESCLKYRKICTAFATASRTHRRRHILKASPLKDQPLGII